MIAWMRAGRGRRGLVGLALLALWLKVMLPPGFMPATDASALLVICTGHGPLTQGSDGKAVPASRADQLCAFADHATSPPGPPTAPVLVPPHWVYLAAIASPVRRMPPLGRRLAAPPPPAQAPPTILA
jgi:hypothetical protein